MATLAGGKRHLQHPNNSIMIYCPSIIYSDPRLVPSCTILYSKVLS
uniref:Uncharacterized protein n=1 Tax=Anguilla anguilla TaxID=7936 RepID=A0A0E9REF5_ANGAN